MKLKKSLARGLIRQNYRPRVRRRSCYQKLNRILCSVSRIGRRISCQSRTKRIRARVSIRYFLVSTHAPVDKSRTGERSDLVAWATHAVVVRIIYKSRIRGIPREQDAALPVLLLPYNRNNT